MYCADINCVGHHDNELQHRVTCLFLNSLSSRRLHGGPLFRYVRGRNIHYPSNLDRSRWHCVHSYRNNVVCTHSDRPLPLSCHNTANGCPRNFECLCSTLFLKHFREFHLHISYRLNCLWSRHLHCDRGASFWKIHPFDIHVDGCFT